MSEGFDHFYAEPSPSDGAGLAGHPLTQEFRRSRRWLPRDIRGGSGCWLGHKVVLRHAEYADGKRPVLPRRKMSWPVTSGRATSSVTTRDQGGSKRSVVRRRNFSAYSPGPAVDGRSEPDTAGHQQAQPPTAKALVRGCLRRWWQVLGSNQRRLSRRFYRPLPLATRATCREPSAQDGTLKDSGTCTTSQQQGV